MSDKVSQPLQENTPQFYENERRLYNENDTLVTKKDWLNDKKISKTKDSTFSVKYHKGTQTKTEQPYDKSKYGTTGNGVRVEEEIIEENTIHTTTIVQGTKTTRTTKEDDIKGSEQICEQCNCKVVQQPNSTRPPLESDKFLTFTFEIIKQEIETPVLCRIGYLPTTEGNLREMVGLSPHPSERPRLPGK